MSKVYRTPSSVAARGGVVYVEGPDGVSVALTPDAALETSDRLLQKSMTVQGQALRGEQSGSDVNSSGSAS